MIYCGTSGYRYINWRGEFYKQYLLQDDWLMVYATNFNFLELVNTYNEIPEKSYFYKLAERTEGKLKFSFFMNQNVTNKNINKSSIYDNLIIARHIEKKYKGLAEETWIGPIVFKFPEFFRFSKENFNKIKEIISVFFEYRRVVELHDNSWINEEVLEFFQRNNIVLELLDTPEFVGQNDLLNYKVFSDITYIRFCGRNRETWWQPESEELKTHYCYSKKELNKFHRDIKNKLLDNCDDVFLVFNNIKNANAVLNAKILNKKFKIIPAFESSQLSLPF
jgi:uncharacterized protein YecE (DUF72 family)